VHGGIVCWDVGDHAGVDPSDEGDERAVRHALRAISAVIVAHDHLAGPDSDEDYCCPGVGAADYVSALLPRLAFNAVR
jgi:hypothetical protein